MNASIDLNRLLWLTFGKWVAWPSISQLIWKIWGKLMRRAQDKQTLCLAAILQPHHLPCFLLSHAINMLVIRQLFGGPKITTLFMYYILTFTPIDTVQFCSTTAPNQLVFNERSQSLLYTIFESHPARSLRDSNRGQSLQLCSCTIY